MKKIFLLSFLIVFSQLAFSQNFAWVQSWGGSTWDYSRSIATDGDGNVFVTGYFRNMVDADPGPGVVNLVSSGEQDIYLSKFNPSGTLLWAKQISGAMNESANELTTDAAGNVYLAGTYSGLVDFDPSSSVVNLANTTSSNPFVCKFTNDGDLIWTKAFNGGGGVAYAIAVDANQNVYTTGRFSALTDFDPMSGVYNLDANDYSDMFVCKLSANGGLVWAKQIAEIGDTDVIKPLSIAVDLQGNVITTGIFNGTVDFDPGAGTFNMISAGEETEVSFPRNVFVSKLDADGNFVWAGSIAEEAEAESTGIAVDDDDNLYISGYFLGTVDFDPGPGVFELTSNAAGANSFICKLDPQGGFEWVKAFSGSSACLVYGLVVEGNDLYTTGCFAGAIDFDPAMATNFLVTSGGFDVFVSKLDLDGNYIWAKKAGGAESENPTAIAVDPASGNVFVTGYFTDTTDFDPSVESWEAASHGEWDCFLLKLSECLPNNGPTETTETCNQYVWTENGGLYTSSGVYWNTLTSVSGCDSTVKLDLTLWDFENEISFDPITNYLTADANAFIDSYQWINCETFAVAGTQGALHVTAGGNYALISTSGNCVDTSACVHVSLADVDELEAAGFRLYPNPVSDHLVFQSSDALQAFEIEVTSVNGQLIYQGKHSGGDVLSTQKWQAGIYVVKIISGGQWYVTRIVKD